MLALMETDIHPSVCMCVLFILNYKHVTELSLMHPARNPSGRRGAEVLLQSCREREKKKRGARELTRETDGK